MAGLEGEEAQKKICSCVCAVHQCINHTYMHPIELGLCSPIERKIIFGFLVL